MSLSQTLIHRVPIPLVFQTGAIKDQRRNRRRMIPGKALVSKPRLALMPRRLVIQSGDIHSNALQFSGLPESGINALSTPPPRFGEQEEGRNSRSTSLSAAAKQLTQQLDEGLSLTTEQGSCLLQPELQPHTVHVSGLLPVQPDLPLHLREGSALLTKPRFESSSLAQRVSGSRTLQPGSSLSAAQDADLPTVQPKSSLLAARGKDSLAVQPASSPHAGGEGRSPMIQPESTLSAGLVSDSLPVQQESPLHLGEGSTLLTVEPRPALAQRVSGSRTLQSGSSLSAAQDADLPTVQPKSSSLAGRGNDSLAVQPASSLHAGGEGRSPMIQPESTLSAGLVSDSLPVQPESPLHLGEGSSLLTVKPKSESSSLAQRGTDSRTSQPDSSLSTAQDADSPTLTVQPKSSSLTARGNDSEAVQPASSPHTGRGRGSCMIQPESTLSTGFISDSLPVTPESPLHLGEANSLLTVGPRSESSSLAQRVSGPRTRQADSSLNTGQDADLPTVQPKSSSLAARGKDSLAVQPASSPHAGRGRGSRMIQPKSTLNAGLVRDSLPVQPEPSPHAGHKSGSLAIQPEPSLHTPKGVRLLTVQPESSPHTVQGSDSLDVQIDSSLHAGRDLPKLQPQSSLSAGLGSDSRTIQPELTQHTGQGSGSQTVQPEPSSQARQGSGLLTVQPELPLQAGKGSGLFTVQIESSPHAVVDSDFSAVQPDSSPHVGEGSDSLVVQADSSQHTGEGSDSLAVQADSSPHAGEVSDSLAVQADSSPHTGERSDSLAAPSQSSPHAGQGYGLIPEQPDFSPRVGHCSDFPAVQADTSPRTGEGSDSLAVGAASLPHAGEGSEALAVQSHSSPHTGQGYGLILQQPDRSPQVGQRNDSLAVQPDLSPHARVRSSSFTARPELQPHTGPGSGLLAVQSDLSSSSQSSLALTDADQGCNQLSVPVSTCVSIDGVGTSLPASVSARGDNHSQRHSKELNERSRTSCSEFTSLPELRQTSRDKPERDLQGQEPRPGVNSDSNDRSSAQVCLPTSSTPVQSQMNRGWATSSTQPLSFDAKRTVPGRASDSQPGGMLEKMRMCSQDVPGVSETERQWNPMPLSNESAATSRDPFYKTRQEEHTTQGTLSGESLVEVCKDELHSLPSSDQLVSGGAFQVSKHHCGRPALRSPGAQHDLPKEDQIVEGAVQAPPSTQMNQRGAIDIGDSPELGIALSRHNSRTLQAGRSTEVTRIDDPLPPSFNDHTETQPLGKTASAVSGDDRAAATSDRSLTSKASSRVISPQTALSWDAAMLKAPPLHRPVENAGSRPPLEDDMLLASTSRETVRPTEQQLSTSAILTSPSTHDHSVIMNLTTARISALSDHPSDQSVSSAQRPEHSQSAHGWPSPGGAFTTSKQGAQSSEMASAGVGGSHTASLDKEWRVQANFPDLKAELVTSTSDPRADCSPIVTDSAYSADRKVTEHSTLDNAQLSAKTEKMDHPPLAHSSDATRQASVSPAAITGKVGHKRLVLRTEAVRRPASSTVSTTQGSDHIAENFTADQLKTSENMPVISLASGVVPQANQAKPVTAHKPTAECPVLSDHPEVTTDDKAQTQGSEFVSPDGNSAGVKISSRHFAAERTSPDQSDLRLMSGGSVGAGASQSKLSERTGVEATFRPGHGRLVEAEDEEKVKARSDCGTIWDVDDESASMGKAHAKPSAIDEKLATADTARDKLSSMDSDQVTRDAIKRKLLAMDEDLAAASTAHDKLSGMDKESAASDPAHDKLSTVDDRPITTDAVKHKFLAMQDQSAAANVDGEERSTIGDRPVLEDQSRDKMWITSDQSRVQQDIMNDTLPPLQAQQDTLEVKVLRDDHRRTMPVFEALPVAEAGLQRMVGSQSTTKDEVPDQQAPNGHHLPAPGIRSSSFCRPPGEGFADGQQSAANQVCSAVQLVTAIAESGRSESPTPLPRAQQVEEVRNAREEKHGRCLLVVKPF